MNKVARSFTFLSFLFIVPSKATSINEKEWVEVWQANIEAASCIAVVDLENIEKSEGGPEKMEQYYDMADAVIVRVLKGKQKGQVKIYGGSPRDFVAIQSGFKKGRFLVFLGIDRDGRLNSKGLFPIQKDKLYSGKQVMDLKSVENEVRSSLEKLKADRIKEVEKIVVVDVQKVVPVNKGFLREKAVGTIVRSVRGDLKGQLEFYGGVSRDLLGGSPSGLVEGRFLVFLMEGKDQRLVGGEEKVLIAASPEFVKPILDGKISWFGVETPLDEVIQKMALKTKK